MNAPCYLVEWYRPELADGLVASFAAAPVTLLMVLAVPTDEVVFGVFSAPSIDAVSDACVQVGLPAERITESDLPLIPGEWQPHPPTSRPCATA